MSRIIYRQLIGLEDFAVGSTVVSQNRGDRLIDIRQVELQFIFRTVNEIKALDYAKFVHIGLHQTGPVIEYYFDPLSFAVPDNDLVIKPAALLAGQPGRYVKHEILDTIIASCSDEHTPLIVDLALPATTFRAPYPLELAYVRASLTAAPVGSDIIVDILMNTVSLFSTLIHIDPATTTSVISATPAVLAVTEVPDDAEFRVYVTQIGSSIAGTGLKVAVTGAKR